MRVGDAGGSTAPARGALAIKAVAASGIDASATRAVRFKQATLRNGERSSTMKLTADALVIWEHKTGEADRVITLLTANGVVSAYAKNSLRPKNKLTSATAMLTYANFELYSGYLPDLTACAECGAQDAPAVHFDRLDGVILCESCARKQGKALNCRRAVLSAMRHILYAEPGRAFSFELGDEAMRELSDLAERYVVTHIERTPATLDFYHSLQ